MRHLSLLTFYTAQTLDFTESLGVEAFDRAEAQTNNPVVPLMPQQTSSLEGVALTSTPSKLVARAVAVTPEGIAQTSTPLLGNGVHK